MQLARKGHFEMFKGYYLSCKIHELNLTTCYNFQRYISVFGTFFLKLFIYFYFLGGSILIKIKERTKQTTLKKIDSCLFSAIVDPFQTGNIHDDCEDSIERKASQLFCLLLPFIIIYLLFFLQNKILDYKISITYFLLICSQSKFSLVGIGPI